MSERAEIYGKCPALVALALSEAGRPLRYDQVARRAGVSLSRARSVLRALVERGRVLREGGRGKFTYRLHRA